MSSNFVSGGSLEEPTQRDDEWVKAQQDIEAERRRKAELKEQHAGKSLFEVLQENKAKKQEAFEESTKLKNQFRSLDDDEIDFLDSVVEKQRAKEAAIRRETAEGLSLFRKQQEDAERAVLEVPAPSTGDTGKDSWAIGAKKRKKGQETGLLKGVKLRKTSSSLLSGNIETKAAGKPESPGTLVITAKSKSVEDEPNTLSVADEKMKAEAAKVANSMRAQASLGLGGYSSDED